MIPSILWNSPVSTAAQHLHNMILPPAYFTVGMVLSGQQSSTFFLQM